MVEIIGIIQELRSGASEREIAQTLAVNRRTVKRYREWAQSRGLLRGELPEVSQLQNWLSEDLGPAGAVPVQVSTVEPYRAEVEQWRSQGIEMKAIWERLKERGYEGSYQAVWRFVRRLEKRKPMSVVRVEREPGEEAQVDFGYVGQMWDEVSGRMRKVWVFVMVLAWSRLMYAELVLDQKVPTWLKCHQNAFAFFGGVPQQVVIDNLKSGIAKNCWEDPEAQLSYRECASHYGFRIAPNRPRKPEHKGKVESGVHYVQRNFIAGQEWQSLREANSALREWCQQTAGERIHGTTKAKPKQRFSEVEQACLQSLPETAYDLAIWKEVKCHRDGYVVFDNGYYSVPCRYVGQTLRLRGGIDTIRIYTPQFELVASHSRGQNPGERMTNLGHLPPEKVPGLLLTAADCLERASQVGGATHELVSQLLADPVMSRLRVAHRLLLLQDKYGVTRLECACARALRYDEVKYGSVKRILQQGLDQEEVPPPPSPAPVATRFVRSAQELLGHLWSGGSA